jgi:hypothetical protein
MKTRSPTVVIAFSLTTAMGIFNLRYSYEFLRNGDVKKEESFKEESLEPILLDVETKSWNDFEITDTENYENTTNK